MLSLEEQTSFDKQQLYQMLDVMGYLNSTSSASELQNHMLIDQIWDIMSIQGKMTKRNLKLLLCCI